MTAVSPRSGGARPLTGEAHVMTKLRARRAPARPIPTPELCDRYGRLYTAAITDVLDHHGHYKQTLPHDIVGLAAYEKFGVF
jgi:hypothetical protein